MTRRDAFVSTIDGVEDEVFMSEMRCIGGERVKLYPVGTMSWCWSEEPQNEQAD